MEKTYTVTVYVAAPGTPLQLPQEKGGTSAAGHMFYTVSNGKDVQSFGFAPIEHGASTGPGKVFSSDLENYKDPRYARTMEVSKEQYDKLVEFGRDPAKHGFNMQYGGLKNSCIDFTWGALNHAGLHQQVQGKPVSNFEGDLKPLNNIDDIKSIEAPVPGSKFNSEKTNPMPARSLRQWMLSELQPAQERTGDPRDPGSPGHGLDNNIRAAVALAESGISKPWDKYSEALTARLYESALGKGFGSGDNLVVGFNDGTDTRRAGEIAFLQRTGPGASPNPQENRVQIPTNELRNANPDETYQRAALQTVQPDVATVVAQQALEQQQRAQRMG